MALLPKRGPSSESLIVFLQKRDQAERVKTNELAFAHVPEYLARKSLWTGCFSSTYAHLRRAREVTVQNSVGDLNHLLHLR